MDFSFLKPTLNVQLPSLTPTTAGIAAAAGTASLAVVLYTSRSWLLSVFFDSVARSRKYKPGQQYLEGNYAPVQEEKFESCTVVEGSIPADLNGFYVKTGPNPFFTPVHGYHWFDGDGMLHGCRLKDGKVSYCNHFVRTSRLQQEQKAGRPLFLKIGDQRGWLGLAVILLGKFMAYIGVYDKSAGEGTANTALQFHARRLMALHEGDLPYVVKLACNGIIETAGRIKGLGKENWPVGRFTAHPKLDAETGELLFFGYNVEKAPYVHYGVFDAKGELSKSFSIDTPWPVMMHDCAMTQHYMVFLHLPLCFEPKVMVQEDKLPLKFRKDLPARIGLLPRSASDASGMIWFELPPFMAFHVFNAFEDNNGTVVKLYACHFNNMDLDLEDMRDPALDMHQVVMEYTLDIPTGNASMRMISPACGDFPVVHPALVGRKFRYGWMGTMDTTSKIPTFNGIAKLDLEAAAKKQDACVARITYPKGCSGGEAVFVPKHPEAPVKGKGEDEGYLLVYVYSEADNKSFLHIYNAKTMSQTPVARVALPQRVPYGFHSTFVNEEQLKTQQAWL